MLKSFRVSALLSAALLVFLTACGGNENNQAASPAPDSPQAASPASPEASPASPAASPAASPNEPAAEGKTKYSYPPQVVKNFVDACTAGRGKDVEKVCTCAINKIQDKYSLEEFTKFDQDVAKGGKPPEDMVEMVKSCRST